MDCGTWRAGSAGWTKCFAWPGRRAAHRAGFRQARERALAENLFHAPENFRAAHRLAVLRQRPGLRLYPGIAEKLSGTTGRGGKNAPIETANVRIISLLGGGMAINCGEKPV